MMGRGLVSGLVSDNIGADIYTYSHSDDLSNWLEFGAFRKDDV